MFCFSSSNSNKLHCHCQVLPVQLCRRLFCFFRAYVFTLLTHNAYLGPRKMLCFQKHGHFTPSLNLTTFAWTSFKTQQWCKHKHKRSEANSTYLTFLHSVKKKREKGRVVNQSKLVITYHLSNKTDNVQ